MKERIQNLDPLRGFLALCVVVYHIPQISNTVGLPNFSDLPIFNRGHQAVLVFFSLSGYLIIGLLYDEKDRFGKINIKNFYLRRILRLYPVYYLVLFFGFFYYHYLLPKFSIPFNINYNLIEGIAWNIGFLPNVFKALYEPGGILIILWSIGIEEQFYLFIAPMLSLIQTNKYFKYLLIFTIIYFIIFHIDYLSFLRTFSLLYFFMSAGGLLAISNRIGITLHFKSLFLRVLVYVIFILHFTTDFFQFDLRILHDAFEVILFSLLIVNLSNDNDFKIKSNIVNYVGKISYGIYMYHMIVVNCVLFLFLKIQDKIIIPEWSTIILINIACIFGTLLLSHFSYKYYESYFLTLKQKFRKEDNKH